MTAVKQKAKHLLQKQHSEFWNASLEPLFVQSKFKGINHPVGTRILHLEPSCCLSTCRPTIIPPSSRYRLSAYPAEPAEMALPCLKLVSTLQLPNPHNCSHPKLMSRSLKIATHDSILSCLVNSVKEELPPWTLCWHAWASNCPPATLPPTFPCPQQDQILS